MTESLIFHEGAISFFILEPSELPVHSWSSLLRLMVWSLGTHIPPFWNILPSELPVHSWGSLLRPMVWPVGTQVHPFWNIPPPELHVHSWSGLLGPSSIPEVTMTITSVWYEGVHRYGASCLQRSGDVYWGVWRCLVLIPAQHSPPGALWAPWLIYTSISPLDKRIIKVSASKSHCGVKLLIL